jgi:glycosyltransferase involved in cell wall biosynthesis
VSLNRTSKKFRILIFSYYWPPAGGAGVQRWVKFVKYLNLLGNEIHVVTPKSPSVPYEDKSLGTEISPDVSINRTKSIEPFSIFNFLRGKKGNQMGAGTTDLFGESPVKKLALYIRSNFFIPDARKGWNSFAYRAGEKLLGSKNFDLIITTGPPHSTHLIGMKLKEKYGVKWISDFRDPWTSIYYLKLFPLSPNAWAKHRKLEKAVLEKADHVTTVSKQLQTELQKTSTEVSILYNGFDESDFENPIGEKKDNSSEFVMSYIGNFKPNQFFEGFLDLIDSALRKYPLLRIKFVGPMDLGVKEEFGRIDKMDKIKFVGPVDHEMALKFMRESDLLLFIIPRGENEKGIITGKIYEYMATRKPILSIGPEDGDAAAVLQKSGSPFPMNDYGSESKILNVLDTLEKNWAEGIRQYEYSGLEFFSRRMQSGDLASLIEKVVDGAQDY